ncbi:PREDICTED: oxysterol-binding protein-related protein 1C [Tarenaya hassleriana]|uniref:oxysterol-binding protein-related protein 1C n=1 Tax=Tarenaya hassleriana TaxID=28532 RepID=UPI00053C5FD9|nr:PREDICTED: oxysterol-binding protein-related protein 1C [Tarenaya hassleriana]
MSSDVSLASNPIATRSASLNINRPSQADHDLRHSLSLGNQIGENRPPSTVMSAVVGSGIAGILYKWVNYGQGWKRRWFVLQDGVLSYYRIHGPDKISLAGEVIRRSKLIGSESLRIAHRHSKRGDVQCHGKSVGEIHLKVASIRQSRSDMKRFTMFTGTKRLHLRAVTNDDRAVWLEALQITKDMFPRMSNKELLAPTTNISISMDQLRQRLLKESVNDAVIKDCEEIMRNEFEELHNEVETLKRKQKLLLDSLKNPNLQIRMQKTPQRGDLNAP